MNSSGNFQALTGGRKMKGKSKPKMMPSLGKMAKMPEMPKIGPKKKKRGGMSDIAMLKGKMA